jgi:pSer/pThr/pTyr-binding forkhead associated (FHA) protein
MSTTPRLAGGGPPHSTDPLPPSVGPVTAEAAFPITQLRVVGEDVVLMLDASSEVFRLGSGLDVHLHLPRRYVSRRHATLRRMPGVIEVTNHSPNGIRVDGQSRDEKILHAGDRFEIGATELLVLDEPGVLLRAVLARMIGFHAHAQVDRALVLALRQVHAPLILTGPRGAEPAELAKAIHAGTPRRSQPFVELDPHAPLADLTRAVTSAVGGTVFVDIAPLKTRRASKSLVTVVGDPASRARVIIGATSDDQVRHAFDHQATKLEGIRTPAVQDRAQEIPALLDAYLASAGSPHRITELPPDRIEAMRQFEWPDNLEEVRRAGVRLAAYLDAERNVSAAARLLGITSQALGEWLVRVGALARRGRGE